MGFSISIHGPSQAVSTSQEPRNNRNPATGQSAGHPENFQSHVQDLCARRSLKSDKPSLFPFHHVIASLPQPIIISAELHQHSWPNETDLLTTDRPMSNPSDCIVSSDPRKRLSRSHQLLKSRKPHPKAEPRLRDSPSLFPANLISHTSEIIAIITTKDHPLRASKT
jgi:hypothetical protein